MEINPLVLIGLTIAIITLVFCGGMQANWRGVIDTFRRPTWLIRAIVAVNVAVPAAAVIACLIFPMDPVVEIAILIMAVSPLAPPISLKLIGTGADASRVTGHFALITMISVLLVPITLALTSSLLGANLTVSVGMVAIIAFVLLLAPMAIGVTVGTFFPSFATRAARPLALFGYVVVMALASPLLVKQAGLIAALAGNGTILAMVLISLAAVTAGDLLGGPKARDRLVLATAAVVRHPGISLSVVGSNALGERAAAAVLLFLVINLLVSALYQNWAKRRYAMAAA